jgi:hypothetical protein
MILPDATPEDLLNYHLRMEALRAQERGDGFSVWHGRDNATGEDVELLINLEDHTGYLSLGKRAVFPGRFVEDGVKLTFRFANDTLGQVDLDLDAEELPMSAHRIGVDYATGEDPKLRLYDKLTGDTLLETEGDAFHELVDEHELDPKDYPGSGLVYLEKMGLV